MLSEYHFQRIVIEGQVLLSNQEPVRDMTRGHPSQREEKTRETLIFLRNLSLVT